MPILRALSKKFTVFFFRDAFGANRTTFTHRRMHYEHIFIKADSGGTDSFHVCNLSLPFNIHQMLNDASHQFL